MRGGANGDGLTFTFPPSCNAAQMNHAHKNILFVNLCEEMNGKNE
jgi:hypothetical protein